MKISYFSSNKQNEIDILGIFDLQTQAQIINNVNDLKSEFLESLPVIFHSKKIGVT